MSKPQEAWPGAFDLPPEPVRKQTPKVRTACPHCHAEFLVAPAAIGRHATCRRCGTPFMVEEIQIVALEDSPTPTRAVEVQKIEMTSKRWKAAQLIGVVVIILASIVFFATAMDAGNRSGPPVATAIAFLAGVLGFILYLYGRIGAWWHHG